MRRFIILSLALLVFLPAVAGARSIDNTGIAGSDIVDGMWDQICSTLPFCNVGEAGVELVAGRVIDFIFSIITMCAVIMIIYGGIMMIVSRGNEEGYATAKKITLAACAGLLIALLAENLVIYVAGELLPGALGG